MNAQIDVGTVKTVLFPVFKQYDIKSAVLFGSVAKGTATENSDVDILVDSRLKGLCFIGLMEDVRKAINRDVDLIDVSHIEKSSPIENEIKKSGIVIYEK